MISHQPFPKNPSVYSIHYPDGSVQNSANITDHFHIKKKLRTEDDSVFNKDLTIEGNLFVHGTIHVMTGSLPDSSKIYVDEQLATLHSLLGWNPVDSKWIYSNTANSTTTNLDYRLNQFFLNYYTKIEMDTQLQHLLGTIYYSGSVGDQYVDPIYGTVHTGKATSIPTGVSFIIPPRIGSVDTILVIQNSSYGNGKVLTSNANGVATWQNPTEMTVGTIQHISTTNGQTNTAAFDIVDSSRPTQYVQFLPNAANVDQLNASLTKDVHRSGDSVLRSTADLTITAGTGSGITRPAGIRMSHHATGELVIFGGWLPETSNSSLYNAGYTGTYSGANIQLSDGNIHIVHDVNKAIKLYGNVLIQQKSPSNPSYNLNTNIIPATLTVNGVTSLTTLKMPTITPNAPVVNYVWTCTNLDGSGRWAAPTATATETTEFTEEVTFEAEVTINAALFVNIVQALSIIVADLNITSSVNIENLATTRTPASSVPTGDISSLNTDSCVYIPKFAKHPQGSLDFEIVERNTTYYFPATLQLGTITVPAQTTTAIEFTRGIFLQQNYCLKSEQVGETVAEFMYSIQSIHFYVQDLTHNTTSQVGIYDDNLKIQGRTVKIVYKKNKSTFNGSNNVANDHSNHHHHSHRVEVDRLNFTFLPAYDTVPVTYRFTIAVEFKALQTIALTDEWQLYQSQRYTNRYDFIASLGGPVYTLVLPEIDPSTGQGIHIVEPPDPAPPPPLYDLLRSNVPYITSNDPWVSWQYNVAIRGNAGLTTAYSYSRYKRITWTQPNKPTYSYEFKIEGNGNPVETFNLQPTITNHEYIYKMGTQTLNTNFIRYYAGRKMVMSGLDVDVLNVNSALNVYGALNSFGLGMKRGRPRYDPFPLVLGNLDMWETSSTNMCNFYWTGTQLQTWVDWTMITQVSPNVSDYRLKSNLRTLQDDYMERLQELTIYDYSLQLPIPGSQITDSHIGFLAHDLKNMFPDHPHLVSGFTDEVDTHGTPIYQTINYNELTVILLKACQELKKECNKTNKKIKKLESSVKNISNIVNAAFIPIALSLAVTIFNLIMPKFWDKLHFEALFSF